MKILILKPSSLGDVVQALPVLRLIKAHKPDAGIFWWIDSRLAPLLENDPDLAGIIRFERNGWGLLKRWLELWRHIRWARAQKFDWVIDLQSLARSGAFGWLTNGKLFVGLDESREGARGYYDIAVPRRSFHTHAVDWYLDVLRALNVPVHENINWLPEKPAVAETVRKKLNFGNAPFIVIQPGARWSNKRWPAENYAELVRQFGKNHPEFRFAVLGGTDDQPLGKIVAGALPERCLDLTGKISLPEMVECIRQSVLMVTNDTGPMHVAAALRKPVVALFGPTEPRRTGPYGQIEQALQLPLPCVPCMKPTCTYFKPFECLRGISPKVVLASLIIDAARLELLDKAPPQ